jgi:S1-C subfamily serine protease
MLRWEDVVRLAVRLNGVPVLGCRAGSPAARAGVRYGDILLSVNHMPTPDWASYIEARGLDRARMRIEVFRGGETLVLELALPPPGEPTDPIALLDELIEGGVMPPPPSVSLRDPEPS